jgi:HK97 family phage portal protein
MARRLEIAGSGRLTVTTKADVDRARVRAESLENPSTDLVTALTDLDDGFGVPTASGISVTPKTAMRHVGAYACIRILSETIGSLPLPIYRTEGRGRVKDRDDWRWPILNTEPNPETGAMELVEHLIGWANLSGKGCAYVEVDKRSGRYTIWPIPANCVERARTPSKQLAYKIRNPVTGKTQLVDPLFVIEVRAFLGLSPIDLARQALGSALAADEYAGRLWANDARPGGLIEWPDTLTDDEFKEFKARWDAGHRGVSKSHLLGVLTGGARWQDVGITPEAAQFLETRKFSVVEMARLFRVPPYLVADLQPGSVSYASVEQQSIDFVVHSLRPWLVRIEQELRRKLFNTTDDVAEGRYPRFSVDGLLRGDTRSRYAAYAIGIQWGWLSPADVRELEDMPEIPNLDRYIAPGAGASPESLARLLDDRPVRGELELAHSNGDRSIGEDV